jgi:hypothetical protein
MKTKHLIKFGVLAIIMYFMLIPNSKAQSPLYDLNWHFETSKSDSFNSATFNTSKWQKLDCYTGVGYNWGGSSAWDAALAKQTGNGYLELQSDTITSPSYYYCFSGNGHKWNIGKKTAGIWSKYSNYSYGYAEINTKLPGFSVSGVGHARKLWPAFWFANDTAACLHDEIDIMDECCSIYADGKTIGSGSGHDVSCVQTNPAPWKSFTNPTPFCDSYHKIAAEWNTDRMIFYIDDVPWYSTYYSYVPMVPMQLVIDFQLFGGYDSLQVPPHGTEEYFEHSDTSNIHSWKIDHFFYWTLNKDCSTSLTILNNTDLSNYWIAGVPAVKSDITIGNGAGSVSLSSGNHIIFRAVNTITINGEFIVPSGAEFTAESTPCN